MPTTTNTSTRESTHSLIREHRGDGTDTVHVMALAESSDSSSVLKQDEEGPDGGSARHDTEPV